MYKEIKEKGGEIYGQKEIIPRRILPGFSSSNA
jgi:hypothetical protein